MFNENLRQIRRIRDLTQAEVATKLNITKSGYANWEQGSSEPNIEAIKKLCQLFNITADELLEMKGLEQNVFYFENSRLEITPMQGVLIQKTRELNDREMTYIINFIEVLKSNQDMRRIVNSA